MKKNKKIWIFLSLMGTAFVLILTNGCKKDDNTGPAIAIGKSYQGGKIAYIFQPGDSGYDSSVVRGIIAAESDQSTDAIWGCLGPLPGGTSTALNTGAANTNAIIAGCSAAGIAAKICDDLLLNGYSDWYLPSKDELYKLYINKSAIGGFADQYYWSSSESVNSYAWNLGLDYGSFSSNYKDGIAHVRAVRSF